MVTSELQDICLFIYICSLMVSSCEMVGDTTLHTFNFFFFLTWYKFSFISVWENAKKRKPDSAVHTLTRKGHRRHQVICARILRWVVMWHLDPGSLFFQELFELGCESHMGHFRNSSSSSNTSRTPLWNARDCVELRNKGSLCTSSIDRKTSRDKESLWEIASTWTAG